MTTSIYVSRSNATSPYHENYPLVTCGPQQVYKHLKLYTFYGSRSGDRGYQRVVHTPRAVQVGCVVHLHYVLRTTSCNPSSQDRRSRIAACSSHLLLPPLLSDALNIFLTDHVT